MAGILIGMKVSGISGQLCIENLNYGAICGQRVLIGLTSMFFGRQVIAKYGFLQQATTLG